jgi:hypothetical protein
VVGGSSNFVQNLPEIKIQPINRLLTSGQAKTHPNSDNKSESFSWKVKQQIFQRNGDSPDK